jgi:AraC-like DNA-binding protein
LHGPVVQAALPFRPMTDVSLVLGKRTAVLLLLAIQGLVVASLLLTARRNRPANRFLAALLTTLSLSLGPDIIGFAGFYDRWPWLTFAPFDVTLLPGPLFYLFVLALTHGDPPFGWRRHLIAPAVELAYLAICFCLPLAPKQEWAAGGHERFVAPVLSVSGLASLVAYTVVSGRILSRYKRWLADHVSHGDEFRLPWLALYIGVMTLLIVGVVAFTLTSPDGVDRYFHWFWFHLGVAVAGFAMGAAGLRAAEWPYPPMIAVAADPVLPASPPDDLSESARQWERMIRDQGWFRDPQLTLSRLADRLAISEVQLSRGLNQGLGKNFNEFVNGLRVASVQEALRDEGERRDLLPIAFDAGFSSKASFNRAFKAATGETPTAFRARYRVSTSPSD